MSTASKAILFETNEVPFSVLDAYTRTHPGSVLAQLMAESKQYNAICEDQIELDPWISWPSLHRGVNDERHQILHLGQSLEYANEHYPPLWELLVRNGIKVGVMGSLHTSATPADLESFEFYVPDFFAHAGFAFPKTLEAFQEFNLLMTRKSGRNVDGHIPVREAFRFLRYYTSSGMTLSTALATIRELATEFFKPHLKCRRRSIQPLISLDIFMHQMERSKPAFATLHTNHVAAAMHRYWEACFPGDVEGGRMPQEWREKYKNEIDYALGVLNTMVGRLKQFADRNGYLLLMCGSLGQAAVKAEITKGFMSIVDVPNFMSRLGLQRSEWSQRFAMAPCITVTVSPEKADQFEKQLKKIRFGDKRMESSKREIAPLSYGRIGDSFHLYVYFENFKAEPVASLNNQPATFDELGWGFHRHEDDVACSARHTPTGALVVYNPGGKSVDTSRSTISTLDIAPTLLQFFGVAPQPYMNTADSNILNTASVGVRDAFTYEGGGVERSIKRIDRGPRLGLQQASARVA